MGSYTRSSVQCPIVRNLILWCSNFERVNWVYTFIYISMWKLFKNYKDWKNICRSIRKEKGATVEQKHLELLWVTADGLGMDWGLISARAEHLLKRPRHPTWSLALMKFDTDPLMKTAPHFLLFQNYNNSVNIFGQGTIVSAG